jgi:putative ABC transport system permease protein
MLDALRHDLRYAVRHLLRSPGFAAAAVLTLALGIGANTAMFSVYNALVLRTLPIPDPDSFVGASSRNPQGQLRLTLISVVAELENDGPFSSVCAFNGGGVMPADVNDTPTQSVIALVTGNCFEVFGVPPILGRAINGGDADDLRGNPVAVISHRFWTQMFGGTPDAIGKVIRMEGAALTVIGVMPEGFAGLHADSGIDLYLPNYTAVSPRRADRPSGAAYILGRLEPGVGIDAAEAQLTARWPSLMAAIAPAALPERERAEFAGAGVRVEPMSTGVNFYRERYAQPVSMILALTGVLLLLACINLGGLLLARLTARGPEIGVRLALGGSRARISQQMIIESLLLSIAGALLAVPIAFAVVGVVGSFVPDPMVNRAVSFAPDFTAIAAAAACGVAAGLMMSAVPVSIAWRGGAMAFGWDRTIAGATNRWARALLVVQVALSVVMLAGAGMLSRSLYLLQHADHGVALDGVLHARIMPLPNAYSDIDNASYFRELEQRLTALPGVRSVGFSRAFPRLISQSLGQPIAFAGEPPGDARAQLEAASPDFFNAVGVPLLRGRRLEWSDHAASQPVAVISASLARQLSPSGEVVGRAVTFGTSREHQNVVVVGVVGNASFGNPRQTALPVFYRPTLQAGRFANYPNLVVATHGDPLALAGAVTQAIREGGREYVHEVTTLAATFARAPSSERMSATLAAAMAALAVVIAFIGIYSLLAYGVSRRTREIGVRVALGATRRDVTRMVMRDGLLLTGIGLAAGLPLAVATGRGLRSLLFGMTETDPLVLALAVAFFALLGATAGWLPARRAARVDPLRALRAE